VCAEAVQLFVAKLSRDTCLSLSVAKAKEASVEFLDETPAKSMLSVRWGIERPSEINVSSMWETYPDEQDESAGDGKVMVQMIQHYSGMLDVLASNPDAARSFVKRGNHVKIENKN
jgi:hypothetical protein